jgi:hypothetical protein
MLLFKANGSGFADTAFSENREVPIHRWVPWVAGFSAGFVGEVLARHAPRGGLVLDPFAGVGTTLVETVIAGPRYRAVGFEINPFAAFAAQTKLEAIGTDPCNLRGLEARFVTEAPRTKPTQPPAGFRSRIPFFSPRVEGQVLRTLGWIHRVADPVSRRLLLLAFGSTMVKFSNYTYEPSLGSRPAVDKPLVEDAPVYSIIAEKLATMISDLEACQRMGRRYGEGQVHARSCYRALEVLGPQSVDLVITSPPYANNYHYLRNTRPQLYWLNLVSSSSDLCAVEQQSLGKFWQTVRQLPDQEINFAFPDLKVILASLRSRNPDRGVYGGRGWANYIATYFNDSFEFLKLLRRLLKPAGVAVIVIGNSIVQGVEVKTDEMLGRLAESRSVGLRVDGLEVARTKRVGNSIINSAVRNAAGRAATLYEAILTLRNPDTQ